MQGMKISILGAGKLGFSIAHGLVESGFYRPGEILLTTRSGAAQPPFTVIRDNVQAVKAAPLVFICVLPQQLDQLLAEIAPHIQPGQQFISTVTGVRIAQLRRALGDDVSIVRAMPNTAIAIRQSMTCICTDGKGDQRLLEQAGSIFSQLGQCRVLREEQMEAATALCACGTAFFMRAIRAASQGGIEIGFHAEEAMLMAAQTALGAAALIVQKGAHPEAEIDHVTSPQGCTIAGLNQMEHSGFSSALIRGITVSAEKAGSLYNR